MTIALQDCRTGHYLDDTGGWTSYVQHARQFQTSAEAINERLRYRVHDALLVFRFEREGYVIRVPLEQIGSESVLAASREASAIRASANASPLAS